MLKLKQFFRYVRNTLAKNSLETPDTKSLNYAWNEIFHRRIYSHPHLGNDAATPDVILDVGANVGAFAVWAAEEYAPRRILCYEASPTTYEYLAKNLHKLKRRFQNTEFIPVHAAVSDSHGEELVIFHRPGRINTSTLMEEGRRRGGRPHPVLSTSISRQLEDRQIDTVDLLKIDVEGHYMSVLKGVKDSDFPRIHRIVMECDWMPEGAPPPAVVSAFLKEKDYVVELDDAEKANNVTLFATHTSLLTR